MIVSTVDLALNFAVSLQVADERFLVLINDLLASGEIPELYADDEYENIMAGLRSEVKGLGLVDSRENCWKFFIERVRRQLKVSSGFRLGAFCGLIRLFCYFVLAIPAPAQKEPL